MSLQLSFENLDETPLPDHIKEKLTEAGFDTPEKVLEASNEDLLAIAGIGRKMLITIRSEVRTDLDKALEPFLRVAAEYGKSFRSDYPASSKVLDMQGKILRVGDFLALFAALGK